jgi:hypothetical protein
MGIIRRPMSRLVLPADRDGLNLIRIDHLPILNGGFPFFAEADHPDGFLLQGPGTIQRLDIADVLLVVTSILKLSGTVAGCGFSSGRTWSLRPSNKMSRRSALCICWMSLNECFK